MDLRDRDVDVSRLTNGGNNWAGEWSADGSRLVFISDREGKVRAWTQPADWQRAAQAITPPIDGLKSAMYSTDGKVLLLNAFVDNVSKVFTSPVGAQSAPAVLIAGSPGSEPRASRPNGRQVAHVSAETGQDEIYVRPYPGPGGRGAGVVDGSSEPIWSRDGRRLFYATGRRMMVATLTPPPNVRVVARDSLFLAGDSFGDFSAATYDAGVDGKNLLMLRTDARACNS
jgi:serine/threonine-protein kinase